MKNHIVNVLFEKWHGYHPIYWDGEAMRYFGYYNVHNSKYPQRYSGYRILQKLNKSESEYKIENKYFYNDNPIEEEDFRRDIPIHHYVCRPIQFGSSFVYRIHLPVTPQSSFFDSLNHGYYIRDVANCFNAKTYYDPFTFSILKDTCFVYVKKEQSIVEAIDQETYPYIARDFLVEHEHIKDFVENMKKMGWIMENPIFSQQDVLNQLGEKAHEIIELKETFKSKEIKERYLHQIFQCINSRQLEKLKGELYIEIADVRNTFTLIWDEALELKNIHRKFTPLKKSPGIFPEDIQHLYSIINEKALDETSAKHKILSELIEIIEWKRNFIDSFSDFNLLKDWILTAMEPMHIFASQLQIKDATTHYKVEDLFKQLTFSNDKYKVSFDERINIQPQQNNKDKTRQEQLKILLEDYKNKPEHYTKRRIQKEIEYYRTTLRMIEEMKSLYIKNDKEKE